MEYKKTLNMSKSGFPMRGGLPMREPEEVFSQVELLRSVGLSVPETTELLYALRADGFDLPLDALSIDQCAQALYDRIKA